MKIAKANIEVKLEIPGAVIRLTGARFSNACLY